MNFFRNIKKKKTRKKSLKKRNKVWDWLLNLAEVSSLGEPGIPWHTQILADQLTLFLPEGIDYAHLITTGTPGFSDLPTALKIFKCIDFLQKN